MSPRVHVLALGCRVSQADGEALLARLAERGLEPSGPGEADVVVIQSCTVTHRADSDLRKLVARLSRERPGVRVVVAGCAAERDPSALSGAALVIGNSRADEAALRVSALSRGEEPTDRVAVGSFEARAPLFVEAPPHARTRPLVKIQDGCDARCTYCVIPSVRGPARSAPVEAVLAQLSALIARGDLELVLTGVHLGTHPALVELVERALELPGLGRLRLSSIEPMAFPRELIAIAARDRRLAPHFHLPMQSGSDRVLKRMNRPYRASELRALLEEIAARVPDACLATDLIAGFPGETEEDFAETLALVERSPLAMIHAFSYSERPGVPSAKLPGKLDARTIRARVRALRALGAEKQRAFLARFVGRRVEAITLRGPPGTIRALTPSYAALEIPGDMPPNRAIDALVVASDGARLTGADPRPAAP